MRKRSIWLIVLGVILAVLLIGLAGFVIWANNAAAPTPEALAALESDDQVVVTSNGWYSFAPRGSEPTTGLIFYPGGRVDARAYAPPAHALAAQGYFVAIPPMPLNLAVLAPDRGLEIMDAHPEIGHWVIGGHSLGGAMAGSFADKHTDTVDGVVFWAAYPPDGNSLAEQNDLVVTSIYGTLDGLATPEKVLGSAPLLPPSANFVPIEGGNHAQFGYYGPQSGDNPATISQEAQQTQAIAATATLLHAIDARPGP